MIAYVNREPPQWSYMPFSEALDLLNENISLFVQVEHESRWKQLNFTERDLPLKYLPLYTFWWADWDIEGSAVNGPKYEQISFNNDAPTRVAIK